MGWFDRRKYSIALRLWHRMHTRRYDKCAEKFSLNTKFTVIGRSIFILDIGCEFLLKNVLNYIHFVSQHKYRITYSKEKKKNEMRLINT